MNCPHGWPAAKSCDRCMREVHRLIAKCVALVHDLALEDNPEARRLVAAFERMGLNMPAELAQAFRTMHPEEPEPLRS